jgi:ABC-2 type transport system permease protein
MPVTYGVDALRAVMLRGADLAAVGFDLAVLWGFLALFFALAAASFRKKRVRTTC